MQVFEPHEKVIDGIIDESTIEYIPNYRQDSSLYKSCFFANLIKEDGTVTKRLFVVKDVDGEDVYRVLDNIPEDEKIISWEHLYTGGMMDNSNSIVIHTLSADSYSFNAGSGCFEPPSDSLTTSDDLGYFLSDPIVEELKENEEANEKIGSSFRNISFYKDTNGKDVIMMNAWGESFKIEPIEPDLDSLFVIDNVTYFLGKIQSKVRNREDKPVEASDEFEDRYRLIVINPANGEEPVKAYRFPFYSPISIELIDKTRAVLTVEAGVETFINNMNDMVEIPNIKKVLICFPNLQLSACYDTIELDEEVIHYSKKQWLREKEVFISGVLEPDGAMGRSVATYLTKIKVPEDNDSDGLSIDIFAKEPFDGELESYPMDENVDDFQDGQSKEWPIEEINPGRRTMEFSCSKKLYKGYYVTVSGTIREDFSLVGGQNLIICATNAMPFLVSTLTTGRKCLDPKLTIKQARACVSACEDFAAELDKIINPPKNQPLMQVLTDKHGE